MPTVSSRLVRQAVGGALGLGLLVSAPVAAAIGLGAMPKAAAGAWDLALGDTNRKCRVTVREEAAPRGHALAMPAGCRRALPILAEVAGWSPASDGALLMIDAAGKDVLRFSADTEGTFTAKGPEGEIYTFAAASAEQRQLFAQATPTPAPLTPGFQVQRPTPPVAVPAAPKPVVLDPVKPGDVPGRYAILRDNGKDTGCMLTLDDKARGPKGGNKALLAPACRDQGMVIFDPAGWAIEKGRLVLTARKGHQTRMDRQSDGTWAKDPKEGKGLGLKKI